DELHGARAEAAVIEDDVTQSVQPMIQRDEQERDVDDLPHGVRNARVDAGKAKIAALKFGGHEVLHPEMRCQQNDQQRAGDALQIPVEGVPHRQTFSTACRNSGIAPTRNTSAPSPTASTQNSRRSRCAIPRSSSVMRTPFSACTITVPSSAISSSLNTGL